MTVIDTRPSTAGDDPLGLVGKVLPPWAVPAVLGSTVAATLLLFAVTPLQGVAGFVVVTAVLFTAAQTAASFAVEGRRRAVDRLFTTLVHSAFGLALIPLASVLATVVSKGAGVINLGATSRPR